MKLHDLTVGQRFTFSDKHRGKVFEVTAKPSSSAKIYGIQYKDVATGETRNAWSNRKTFRMPVQLVTENIVVELAPHEVGMIKQVLHERYMLMCEAGYSEASKSEMDNLLIKITESAGRRPNNDEI